MNMTKDLENWIMENNPYLWILKFDLRYELGLYDVWNDGARQMAEHLQSQQTLPEPNEEAINKTAESWWDDDWEAIEGNDQRELIMELLSKTLKKGIEYGYYNFNLLKANG